MRRDVACRVRAVVGVSANWSTAAIARNYSMEQITRARGATSSMCSRVQPGVRDRAIGVGPIAESVRHRRGAGCAEVARYARSRATASRPKLRQRSVCLLSR